jgi:hypothetical protein
MNATQFPKLTDAEITAAERRMKTKGFRRKVERLRARHKAGEPLNFPNIAKELGIPIQIVLAFFAKHVEDTTGMIIRPMAKAN